MIKGILFDLDGVITDTAEYHYFAWRELAEKYNLRFSRKTNEKLKGISRKESLMIILKDNKVEYNDDIIDKMLIEKNETYLRYLKTLSPKDILPGIQEILDYCKNNDLRTVVASASKNAETVLDSLNLKKYFDCVVDVNSIKKMKPDPEVFIKGYKLVNLSSSDVIGIEDSQAGIDALNKANIMSVGIGDNLKHCDVLFRTTKELDLNLINKVFNNCK